MRHAHVPSSPPFLSLTVLLPAGLLIMPLTRLLQLTGSCLALPCLVASAACLRASCKHNKYAVIKPNRSPMLVKFPMTIVRLQMSSLIGAPQLSTPCRKYCQEVLGVLGVIVVVSHCQALWHLIRNVKGSRGGQNEVPGKLSQIMVYYAIRFVRELSFNLCLPSNSRRLLFCSDCCCFCLLLLSIRITYTHT